MMLSFRTIAALTTASAIGVACGSSGTTGSADGSAANDGAGQASPDAAEGATGTGGGDRDGSGGGGGDANETGQSDGGAGDAGRETTTADGGGSDGGTGPAEEGGTADSSTDAISAKDGSETDATVGFVACGTRMCDLAKDYCCNTFSPTAQACVPQTSTCGGNSIGCNQAADCPAGQKCIEESIAPLSTSCEPAGVSPLILCGGDGDCSPGTKCVTQTCKTPNPVQLSTCGGMGCAH